ncbi:MAG: hypothetical protein CL927_18790 [Deltaproteobacteria bacterium]|nr:hypothetical protein [Deltaproteobacteria bacterium]HCH62741.1 hypothetical protein [Deltaproteobacteria bacterium]
MPSDPFLSALAAETEATPADRTRLRALIRARHAASSRPWLPILAPVVGLATAGLLWLMLIDGPPEPVAATFDANESQTLHLASGIQLATRGTGTLSGTDRAPRLAWSAGTVELSVQPSAGLDVQVRTEEALVQVVGTEFSVDRGPLGTRVDVTRGLVSVTCDNGTEQALAAGETATCWPTTAAGLLGRAQALREQFAPPEAILGTVEQGFGRSPSTAIYTELSALRVVLLSEGSDPTAAIPAAREHLSVAETGRRAEIARIGASLGYQQAGCDGATPFIEELPAKEVAASALSMCQTPGEAGQLR